MPLNFPKSLTDEQFERHLLESARSDSAPSNVDQAWANFANMMQQVATGTEAGSGLHQAVGNRADHTPKDAGLMSPTGVSPALQWLLVGALAGSVITATAMLASRTRPTHEPARQNIQEAPPVRPRPLADSRLDSPRDPVKTDVVAALPTRVTPVPALSHAGHAGVVAASHESAPEAVAGTSFASNQILPPTPSQSSSSSASSDLAEQVRRLDAARTALSVGSNQEALRVVESYHRDFPNGVLSLDAEVVAIEALAAQHNGAQVARRAAAFLTEHPDDPHAARVKWLAEH